jgi:hypothetical protein
MSFFAAAVVVVVVEIIQLLRFCGCEGAGERIQIQGGRQQTCKVEGVCCVVLCVCVREREMVKVLFFASAREKAGCSSHDFEIKRKYSLACLLACYQRCSVCA